MAVVADERERLTSFEMKDLRVIAEEIGAPGARSKAQIVENIMAKKLGEEATALEEELAPEEEASEAESEQEAEELDPELEQPSLDLIKHMMLTMNEPANPEISVYDSEGINQIINGWFERGYDPIEFQTLGSGPAGHRLFYVLKKVERPKYKRSLHIMRLLTPTANPLRGTISGFQADSYVSAFLEAGWKLIGARYNGDDVVGEQTMGIYVIWMLAK